MIAVTGALGFIGSCLVWLLNQQGERDVLCVDTRPSPGEDSNLSFLSYRDYVPHDSFQRRFRDGAWPDLEVVFHMGACSSTTETDWDYLERNNVVYSQELCLASVERGVRFIHAGSAATYGDGTRGYSDDHARLEELEPLNAYGRSKHVFDLWALKRGLLDKIVVLKYFNVYGPNEWHKGEMRSMVCKGFEQIQASGRIRLFRSDRPEVLDGDQRRDFVYVKDAAAVTLWFHGQPGANGVFNVGTGAAATWNRLAAAIFAAAGRELHIDYIDMPKELRGRYQDYTQAEMSKLRQAGYTAPSTSLENAVADYVHHYLVPHRHLGE